MRPLGCGLRVGRGGGKTVTSCYKLFSFKEFVTVTSLGYYNYMNMIFLKKGILKEGIGPLITVPHERKAWWVQHRARPGSRPSIAIS